MNKIFNFLKDKINLNFSKDNMYATPIRRIGSGLIDLFIVFVIFTLIASVANYYGFDMEIYKQEVKVIENKDEANEKNLEYVDVIDPKILYRSQIISFIISSVYFTYFLSSKKQATIGNQIFKIMVVDIKNQNGKVSPLTAFIRYLLFLLNNNAFGAGYILYFFTKDHCFLQDYLSNTRVIVIK